MFLGEIWAIQSMTTDLFTEKVKQLQRTVGRKIVLKNAGMEYTSSSRERKLKNMNKTVKSLLFAFNTIIVSERVGGWGKLFHDAMWFLDGYVMEWFDYYE